VTERVYLHVGAPKSGTTYLQATLADNRAALAAAGMTVLGERHVDLVHAAMVIRDDPRLDKLPERASGAWDRVLEEIGAWDGESAILSYELLAGATPEQAAGALAALSAYDVHVIITARDFARALPSAWQERLKFALTTPLEEWQPRPDTDARSEWGWRTLDPAGVAARWGASLPKDRVHIVTMPPGGDPAELWRRFAQACGLEGVDVQLPDGRENTSLSVAAAEVLRRVNELATAPIVGNREHALWLRDTLAHRVLASLGDESIGLTDAQYAEAEQRADQSRARLAKAGHPWHGDPDDLGPIRPDARTPGDVGADELLDVAIGAIWKLLLVTREASSARPEPVAPAAPDPPAGPVAAVRQLVQGVPRRRAALEERVEQLEAELALSRQLQNRLAMVTDVVAELLLPQRDQDPSRLEHAVRVYRRETL
jgi:hypothetical protein